MLPTKFTVADAETERARYKIVRLDKMTDVDGPQSLILSANVETGLCLIRKSDGAQQEYNFGPGGLAIVGR